MHVIDRLFYEIASAAAFAIELSRSYTVRALFDSEALFALARGSYQRALLRGETAWSGATLRGGARVWGARYARSRASLIERLEANGYEVTLLRVRRCGDSLCVADNGALTALITVGREG